jgi:hypothetical protein
MRTLKWLAVAALAIPAAGCVESTDQGYGYSNGYYSNGYSGGSYSPAYYATPSVSNYYYTQAPTVVTQTRSVPVPVPAAVPARPQQQSPQHVDRPRTPPQANNNPQPVNTGGDHRNGNGRDRNGDGQPDRRS